MSLAVKYRPTEFSDVSSQKSVVKILEKQIETKTIPNCLLFIGASGCGKTTLAKIVANKLNNGIGAPIEIDGASHGNVDNVRLICSESENSPIGMNYNVFIVDECHAISSAGWQAFLKTIEEPPKYSIFIFCTTDPQKVPETIKNRCQVFKLSRLSDDEIIHRLDYICNQEHYTFYIEALEYICKMSNGSMRQAISYLDMCKDYSTDITLQNVIDCLGDYSYDIYFRLTNYLIDGDKISATGEIDKLFIKGADLKLFVSNYLDFIIQVAKFSILKNISVCNIPSAFEEKLKYTVGIENANQYFKNLVDSILRLKVIIKNDSDVKSTIQAFLISI